MSNHLERPGTYIYCRCNRCGYESWYHEKDLKVCPRDGNKLVKADKAKDKIEHEKRLRRLGCW